MCQIAEVWHSIHGKPDFKQASAVLILVDRKRWITAGYDSKLKLWDFSGQKLGEIGIENKADYKIFDLTLTPDSKQVAALSRLRARAYLWPLDAFEIRNASPSRIYQVSGDTKYSAFAFKPTADRKAPGDRL